jgi:hypothetical protein
MKLKTPEPGTKPACHSGVPFDLEDMRSIVQQTLETREGG